MSTAKKIKVLIIDDSALVRRTLKACIESADDLEVVGVAANPYIAVEKMKQQKPDVITLDIEMPRMDGLTFLRKLMSQHPIPVLVLSSLTQKGSEVAFRSFQYGAVDVILKEDINLVSSNEAGLAILLEKIRSAGKANIKRHIQAKELEVKPIKSDLTTIKTTDKIIVMGASTGGTQALEHIISALPINTPGTVIVQHMPKMFTKHFADRLNNHSVLTVKEAEEGDTVVPSKVLIAPGDQHVILVRQGAQIVVKYWKGPEVNGHKPSVDVLFESAAKQLGQNAIGVLLTGMGKDGAKGLLSLQEAKAHTIAQDRETSVVFGMPGEAVKLGAARKVLPLDLIPQALINQNGKGR